MPTDRIIGDILALAFTVILSFKNFNLANKIKKAFRLGCYTSRVHLTHQDLQPPPVLRSKDMVTFELQNYLAYKMKTIMPRCHVHVPHRDLLPPPI